MTDEAIMMKLAGGDLDMATLLFERYQLKIYNFFSVFREFKVDLLKIEFQGVRILLLELIRPYNELVSIFQKALREVVIDGGSIMHYAVGN